MRKEKILHLEDWVKSMHYGFGTDSWRNQVEEAFRKDKFNPNIHKDAVTWALRQKKGVKAFAPKCTYQ